MQAAQELPALPPRTQQLANLVLRQCYQAEQLGIDTITLRETRDTVRAVCEQHESALRFIDEHGDMLTPNERELLIDQQWQRFSTGMFGLAMAVAEMVRQRVANGAQPKTHAVQWQPNPQPSSAAH